MISIYDQRPSDEKRTKKHASDSLELITHVKERFRLSYVIS